MAESGMSSTSSDSSCHRDLATRPYPIRYEAQILWKFIIFDSIEARSYSRTEEVGLTRWLFWLAWRMMDEEQIKLSAYQLKKKKEKDGKDSY